MKYRSQKFIKRPSMAMDAWLGEKRNVEPHELVAPIKSKIRSGNIRQSTCIHHTAMCSSLSFQAVKTRCVHTHTHKKKKTRTKTSTKPKVSKYLSKVKILKQGSKC